MKFQEKLIKGKFIKRYKRFFADVELENGDIAIAHCANTGSMKGVIDSEIAYISYVDNPNRKLKYTLQILQKGEVKVGVNTHLTNHLAVEAIKNAKVSELADFEELKTEVKYGLQNSRIDILLTESDGTKHYVEVKNISLAENGVAMFPDSVTLRGQKHLQELMEMVRLGEKATMLYVINRDDCNSFRPAYEIDPEYAKLLKQAISEGVQALAYCCKFNDDEITLDKKLSISLDY
ncbi:MAG: DNA/RNA nuclease SfsA [Proteobacteria bacterium]|nr:DNA/RNA nuclease SfsA [Pseudomonadota bacterium]